jgi:hypothetical protein
MGGKTSQDEQQDDAGKDIAADHDGQGLPCGRLDHEPARAPENGSEDKEAYGSAARGW